MKKVLLVNIFDGFAGSQRCLETIIKYQGQKEVKFYLLNVFGPGMISQKEVADHVFTLFNIESLKVRKWLFLFLLPLLILLINILSFFFNRTVGNTIYTALLLPPSKRNFVVVHEVSRLPGMIKRLFFLVKKHNCLVVSNIVNEKLHLQGKVIYNPVNNFKGYEYEPYTSDLKKLVYVGDFRPAKRYSYFIELVAQIRQSGSKEFIFVMYLANQPRTEEESKLIDKAKALNVEVNYSIFEPEVFFKDTYAVVIPTDENQWVETFSYVACEALACGVPLISTGISVLDELYSSAILINENITPFEMTKLILGLDSESYISARKSTKGLAKRFSVENFNDKLIACLDLSVD